MSKFLSDRVFIAGMLKQWLVKSFNFTPLAAVAGKVEHKRGYYLGMKTNFSSKACNMALSLQGVLITINQNGFSILFIAQIS